jgi:predicted phosphoribosyltransferase
LGSESAFEQAEKIGLHQKDYAAIKALPAPDQELVRRAVEEAVSRDDVLEILQEMAAKNYREITSLQKSVATKDQVIADEKTENIKLREKLAESDVDVIPPDAAPALALERGLTQAKEQAKNAFAALSLYLSQNAKSLAANDEEIQRIKEDAFDDFLRYVRKHLRAQALDALEIMRVVVADDEAAAGYLDFARAGLLDDLAPEPDETDDHDHAGV